MYIIAGLGNPGKKYEYTKHNVGFLAIDILAGKLGIKVNKLKHKALTGEGFIAGEKVLLVKPQTYMNLSGESLREVMSFYKAETDHLIVIYDDIDIGLGSIRIRKKGSAGTHNGMRSVIYQLNSEDFPRIRVGIGSENKGDLVDYVISGFKGEDARIIEESITKAADAAYCIVEKGIDIAMGEYNKRVKKPKKSENEVAENDDKTQADGYDKINADISADRLAGACDDAPGDETQGVKSAATACEETGKIADSPVSEGEEAEVKSAVTACKAEEGKPKTKGLRGLFARRNRD